MMPRKVSRNGLKQVIAPVPSASGQCCEYNVEQDQRCCSTSKLQVLGECAAQDVSWRAIRAILCTFAIT